MRCAQRHELRTPLASLKAELELALRPGRSPGELRAAVASAGDETEHLIRLTEDLLTVARADARRLALTREAVDVAALMGLVAGRARVTVAVDVPADLVVEGDPLRLQQALGNLVDNAHRHGAAPVTMRAVPSADTIRLEVEDRGGGVPDDLRKRAFERFTRGDEAREGPGAGLGLAIVAAIAEAHGGRAGVDDAPGGGTIAWVELPRS